VQDRTDSDWWQGKCLGRLGYFPSKYVTKLAAGEKPLQVTLLRDQIVIQVIGSDFSAGNLKKLQCAMGGILKKRVFLQGNHKKYVFFTYKSIKSTEKLTVCKEYIKSK
jgi:hypothetical protein